jgi:hypothetical protein
MLLLSKRGNCAGALAAWLNADTKSDRAIRDMDSKIPPQQDEVQVRNEAAKMHGDCGAMNFPITPTR